MHGTHRGLYLQAQQGTALPIGQLHGCHWAPNGASVWTRQEYAHRDAAVNRRLHTDAMRQTQHNGQACASNTHSNTHKPTRTPQQASMCPNPLSLPNHVIYFGTPCALVKLTGGQKPIRVARVMASSRSTTPGIHKKRASPQAYIYCIGQPDVKDTLHPSRVQQHCKPRAHGLDSL